MDPVGQVQRQKQSGQFKQLKISSDTRCSSCLSLDSWALDTRQGRRRAIWSLTCITFCNKLQVTLFGHRGRSPLLSTHAGVFFVYLSLCLVSCINLHAVWFKVLQRPLLTPTSSSIKKKKHLKIHLKPWWHLLPHCPLKVNPQLGKSPKSVKMTNKTILLGFSPFAESEMLTASWQIKDCTKKPPPKSQGNTIDFL